jgi:hypothetical protein
MFFRVKPARGYRYLQIARSVRVEGKVRQEIIATLAGSMFCKRVDNLIVC